MQRSDRDHQILEALACKVRVMSLAQIAAAWWPEGATPLIHAQRRMKELYEAVFVDELTVLGGPMLNLTEPLVLWRRGDPDPDFGAVAWRLTSRWPKVAASRMTVFTATQDTHNQYGGAVTPRGIKRGQVTHDLHVTTVYLHYLRTDPAGAAAWVGEDTRPKSGYRMKDPDAVLEFTDGRPVHAVEFGGRYEMERVRDFHADCAARGRTYELW